MPMFGAPRTASRRIACAVSAAPVSVSHISAWGRSVWSRTLRRRPSHRSAWIIGTETAMAPDGIGPAPRRLPYCSPLVLRTRAAAAIAAITALAVPAAAHAADPIMPLGQVQAGMRCTGYSVIRGTDISSFDVEVIDVLNGADPQILVRVSGPAVEPHGIAEGFSGSPVKCPDADGTPRTIGAIAQGTGDYGNKVVLVSPIEVLLGEPVDVPAGAKPMPKALR